jgi:hypothetical protein
MLNCFYRSKAVSDGAIIWECAGLVIARRARFSLGSTMSLHYDEENPAHRLRKKFVGLDGVEYISHTWAQIVEKVSCLP